MGTHFISNRDVGYAVSAAISQAKSEICLTSPWIIGERLQSLFSEDVRNRIREGEVRLKVVIRLRELSDMEITNATTFNFLRGIGAEFRFSAQLHAKLVIIDDKIAFASSSNITGAGYRDELLGGNEEAGFYTDETGEVLKAKVRFEEIWDRARPVSDKTIGLILSPATENDFAFVVLRPIECGSFVSANRRDGSLILAQVDKIECINPKFFSHLAQPGSQILADFFNIYSNPDPDHRYLASMAYLDGDAEISIAYCDIIAEIDSLLAQSSETIRRQDWKTCLTPLSVAIEVSKASNELLARFFSQRLVSLGRIINHEAPIGIIPEEILSKHCAIFGMTGSGKSNCAKVFVERFFEWGKSNNTRVVILDPHAEYSKSTTFGQRCVEIEYRDAVAKRFIEDVDGLVQLAGLQFNKDNKLLAGYQRELLNKAIAEASSFSQLAERVARDNVIHLTSEQRSLHLGIDEATLDKLSRAQASNELSKVASILSKVETDAIRLTETEERQLKEYFLRKQLLELARKYQEEEVSEQVEEVQLFQEDEINRIKELEKLATLHDIPLSFDKVAIYDINLRDIDDPSYKWEVAGKVVEQLFNQAKRDTDFRVLIVAEEAQNFLSGGGRANRAASALERVAREGRKFGVGLLLISQRPAGLQTDVVAQCNTQIIFRLVNPNDLNYIESTAEAASQELLSMLPKLATGCCYVAGVAVPMAMLAQIDEYK
jgi:hypothetical protein